MPIESTDHASSGTPAPPLTVGGCVAFQGQPGAYGEEAIERLWRGDFPARAARDLGWTDVPMLCGTEMSVPGAVAHCVRVLLHVELTGDHLAVQHVYLRGAAVLRPDLDGAR